LPFGVRSRKRKIPTGSSKLNKIKSASEINNKEMQDIREAMTKAFARNESALGFDLVDYLAMDDVESSRWITDQLAKTLKEKMSTRKDFFEPLEMLRGCQPVEARACARYNRGKLCPSQRHFETKPKTSSLICERVSGEELRLHCCVLCLETLDIICGHPLVQCPWVQETTWNKLQMKNEKSQIEKFEENFESMFFI
jgi:hypothetical protein